MDYSTKNTCLYKIHVFRPTIEEFRNFAGYIDQIESIGGAKPGLAKVKEFSLNFSKPSNCIHLYNYNFSKSELAEFNFKKNFLLQIIPPKEWVARKTGYKDVNLNIPAPIKQACSGNKGLFQQLNIQTKPMSVKEFSKLANSPK